MHEEQEKKSSRGNFNGFFLWLSVVMGSIVVVIASYGVWIERAYIGYIGLVWLVTSALLPTIGIAFLTAMLIRFITKVDFSDIGMTGSVTRDFLGRVQEWHPLGVKEAKGSTTTVKEVSSPKCDTLGDVLEKGYIVPHSERFLLGMSSDNAPVYGDYSRIRSVIVAGISGMGKTVTMVFIIVQVMLSKAAHITVVDPHYKKPDGLTQRLKPLAKYGTFVHTDTDTIKAVTDVKEELERRIAGQEWNTARVLVIDEWNRIASRNKEVFDLVKWVIEEIAQEGRGFDVYVILAGQIWQPSKSGGSSIINSFASVFLHRLKRQQSKFLGVDSSVQKQVENLHAGCVFLSDALGEVEALSIPECKYRDAITVRDMLHSLPPLVQGEEQRLIEAPINVNVQEECFTLESPQTPVNGPVNSQVSAFEPPINGLINGLEGPVTDSIKAQTREYKLSPEDIKTIVLLGLEEYEPLSKISKQVGLYGSQYWKFSSLLQELGVDVEDYIKRRTEFMSREKVVS